MDKNLKSSEEFVDLQSCLSKNSIDLCVESLPVENSIMWSRIKSFNSVNNDENESNTGIF